jgi:transcriptional regulator with XRE-family HTH domain
MSTIDWTITFATRLREVRTARALSQSALAIRIGKHPTYISHLEVGKRLPSLNTLFEIAEALDVGPTSLLEEGGDGDE